jgi:hypothetical protein
MKEKVKKSVGLKTRPAWLQRPPGREPAGLPRRLGLPGVASAAMQALRWLMAITSSRDPTLIVKEQGPWRRTA